jgi:O-6-methylguanine DNA methyltransferase
MKTFSDRVYEVVSKIPKGSVMTYKQVARALGEPNAARAVGNALNKNPNPIRVPCHRVVRSDGKVGGYAKGTEKKIELLKVEGVAVENGCIILGL